MTRKTWLTAALAIAVALAFVGCSNPTSSDDNDYKGVLGNIAGVVYDDVTGMPIKDARVVIGSWGTWTDETGSYIIEDIIPGDYTLTVVVDGYTAYSQNDVRVNAKQYTEVDDPFLEAANLQKQIDLFERWIAAYEKSNSPVGYPNPADYPEYLADLTTGDTWTYTGGGIYVNDDAQASISITETSGDSAFPRYEVVYNKLDYTYSYGIRVDVIKLTPLTGGFTGKIDVLFEKANTTLALGGSVPIKAGVEIYFVDVAEHAISLTDGVTRKYGPFVTKADGSFVANGLPAKTDFVIEISTFSQPKVGGEEYYFVPELDGDYDPDDLETYLFGNIFKVGDWETAKAPMIYTTSVGNSVEKDVEFPGATEDDPPTYADVWEGYTDLGKFFIFTVGNVAYVTSGNVPNADAPLAISSVTPGAITLTFNKAIFTGNFTATLNLSPVAPALSNAAYTNATAQALQATWNSAGTTVTLRAGEKLEGYNTILFPYAVDSSKPVGKLVISGTAADGSVIYGFGDDNEPKTWNVYTEPALALDGIQFITAAAAPVRVVSDVGGAIKLTFNKALDTTTPTTSFTIGGVAAAYKFDPDDAKVVYVYTDVEINTATELVYVVVSATDSADAITANNVLDDLLVQLPPLVLKSATLYSGRDGMGYKPSLEAHFPVDGRIVFTFNDIPEDAVASAAFDSGLYAPAVVDADLNTVTVTPALLVPDTQYDFTLRIVRSAAEPYTIYDSPVVPVDETDTPAPGAVGPLYITGTVVASRISFKTAPSELVPVSANLYTDRSGFAYTPGPGAYFPVDSDIVITFADIPAGAVAKAVFDSGTYAPAIIDGNTVTISPAQLTANTATPFTLTIIKSSAQPYVLYSTPGMPGGVAGAVGPLYIVGASAAAPRISFTPATSELILVGTNLYVDRDGIQKTPVNTALFSGNAIEFTFDSLPAGAVIVSELKEENVTTPIPVTVTTDQANRKVTLTPIQLKRDKKYSLSLEILSSGSQRTLYKNPVAAGVPPAAGAVGLLYINVSNLIEFTTAAIEPLADLLSTNLYINPDTTVDTTPADDLYFFPINGNIVLTFGSAVPTGAVLDVQLRDVRYNLIRTTNTTSATARTLTINPDEDLKPSDTYYLWVRIMDTTDDPYWTVLATTSGVALSQPFTADPGPNDSHYYIGFSTQKDQQARLVSTNLYLDGNPANNGLDSNAAYVKNTGANFRLDGTIELEFAGIPTGTTISKVILAPAPGGTGRSVYAKIDPLNAATNTNKVTIKPTENLAPGTYYLQLALSKTVGADPVWEVNATNGADGLHGPVYVAEANKEIVFKTVTRFEAKSSGVGSLTNIGLTGAAVASGNTTAQFTATSDIAIEFDRPIATVTKAQLRFYRDSEFFTPIDSYKLSDDKTVLYITPANMLAPNETFVVRLAVTAADGQQIVYDSTNTGDSTTWANGAFYNQDLRIRTKDVAIFTGIPIGRQPASGGTLATTPATGNIGKTETSMSLVFTAAAAGFQQDYAIYVRRFDVWNTTTPVRSNITVNQGQTAPAAGNPLVVAIPDDGISSPYNHTTGENIQYKARGINNYGYVAEATSRSLPFAP